MILCHTLRFGAVDDHLKTSGIDELLNVLHTVNVTACTDFDFNITVNVADNLYVALMLFICCGDVYNIILDRRENPKEGSYTNLLLEKGLDNILKKVGEENTEIIIAAKNTDHEHLKYEISDYIYHLMVLMAEKDITWEEITQELSQRK
jgi:phosphoribosyl-ATP pyrophosphohydrolase